jgi:hypothetical protein
MLRFLAALALSVAFVSLTISILGREGTVAVLTQAPSLQVPVSAAGRPAGIAVGNPDAGVLGLDDFSGSAQDAWPSAAKGGSYVLVGPADDFAEQSGAGIIRTPAGQVRGATLSGVQARDVDLHVKVAVDHPAAGGDEFAYLALRQQDDLTNYLARLRLDVNHKAWIQFARKIGANTDLLGAERAVDFGAGDTSIWLRAVAVGDQPTTLRLKAWTDGATEPQDWQYTVTDSQPDLAGPGAVGLQTYVSVRATNAPITFRFSDFRVSPAGLDVLAQKLAPSPTAVPVSAASSVASPPTPTAVPSPAAVETASDVWPTVGPELDSAWGNDTPRTLSLLDAYLTQFPDDQAARDKMYAALLASAQDLEDSGDRAGAIAELNRAHNLLPTRGEANVELTRLGGAPSAQAESLPAPTPVAPRAAAVQTTRSTQAPPPAIRPAPPAQAPAAAEIRAPVPTPTKIPFAIPTGP